MKAYKGFDANLKCRGFQYEVGKTYEEPEASLCNKGFHACENPLDALNYYPLINDDGKKNRFAEVELDATDATSDDSKRVGKKIEIKAELNLEGLIKAGIDFLFESNTAKKNAKEVSSARLAQLAASGDCSQLAASGYGSQLAASGDGSQLAASGDCSKLAASGDGSVVMNAGIKGRAKAAKRCWITLAEWNYDEKWSVVAVVTKQVDDEEIKADTWYQLVDGKFQAVEG